jgi:hypothetical protein
VIRGVPGRSLEIEGSLDRSRRVVGHAGELATAAVLAEYEAGHPEVAVLHSLRLPRRSVDIDHVVVAGARVWVLDSKCWAPGFHWGWGGRHRAGIRERADYRSSAPMAAHFLKRYLGSRTSVEVPVVVVWPSSGRGALRLWAWRPNGLSRVSGKQLRRFLERSVVPARADPWIVARLEGLLVCPPT